MPHFRLTWLDADGRVCQRNLHAEHRAQLADRAGLAAWQLLDAQPIDATSATSPRGFAPRSRRLPLRTWCQELATLLDAGVPLPEALQALAEQSPAAEARTLRTLAEALQSGLPFSQALAADATAFGTLLPALAAASERTGQLATVLRQHADYLGWLEKLQARMSRAALYPALLAGTGLVVVLFLLVGVLPRFAGVFDGLATPLPWGSRMLLSLGQGLRDHAGSALAGLAVLGAVAAAAASRPGWRRRLWATLPHFPLVGERWRVLVLARLLRTLGLLLQAGVPVAAALPLARGVVAAPWQPGLDRATAHVESGLPLSQALSREGLDTPVVRRLLRVAEHSGRLPELLTRAAGFLDERIGRWADLATEALSPLLMLAIGLLVGGILVLMYLPIFQLVEMVG